MFGSSFLAFVQVSIIFSLTLVSQGLSRSENNGPTLDNIFDIRPSEKVYFDPEPTNERPIIGVLAQEISYSLVDFFPNSSSYISASYVKFLEAAGARVVPVLINQNEEYYQMIFNSTNGILFPGGSANIYDSGYARAGKLFYDMALEAFDSRGDFYPIWGTCLGMELLALFPVDGQESLKACNSWEQPLPLVFRDEWYTSRIGKSSNDEINQIFSTQNVTMNFHHWCLTQENFTKFEMEKFWTPLATGADFDGLEFIAAMEAKDYPIWVTQFHPEKNAFEWTLKYPTIPHSADAIKSATFFANFFVQQSRKNFHSFVNRTEEEKYLIYNEIPVFTGQASIDFSMTQSYLFP